MTTGYAKNKDGLVVLTMTEHDYCSLLLALGYRVGAEKDPALEKQLLDLVNRLNAGNPKWVPYTTAPTATEPRRPRKTGRAE